MFKKLTSLKGLLIIGSTTFMILSLSIAGYLYYLASSLPPLFSITDYKPNLVSEVYARDGQKIGEFYRENRILIPFDKIPKQLINAFLAAEDGSFFEHGGINFQAIVRAMLANIRAGGNVQGASTITQQTARTLFLSREKTITRKLKEVIMTYRMESHLSKEEILFLYLNQIYFGQGAHGIGSAAETYFRKRVNQLSLAEMTMIASLPKAPSRFNPVVRPKRAKIRQLYVLDRMVKEGFIKEEERQVSAKEVIRAHAQKNYKKVGPYLVEAVRQLLNQELGSDKVLDSGLRIHTSLDYDKQMAAQGAVRKGLREVDKRQGYRGAVKNIAKENFKETLEKQREQLLKEKREVVEIQSDGSTSEVPPFALFQKQKADGTVITNTPPYVAKGEVISGLVTKISDSLGLVFVRFAEGQGLIDIDDMKWARVPNPDVFYGDYLHIKKPSKALKVGDLIDIRVNKGIFDSTMFNKRMSKARKKLIKNKPQFQNYADLSLEQRPKVEGSLLSFDLKTKDIIAMVGGFNFADTELNRTYQSKRQTGSSFKPIVYAAGLMKGLTPASPIMGSPIVKGGTQYDDDDNEDNPDESKKTEAWKPGNYDGRFTGDILLRNALKRSLNTPTIRVFEAAGGTNFVAQLARRLGIFSPLNMDLSMALGSSGVTVYEMTKAFSVLASQGKKFVPRLIKRVESPEGETLFKDVSLDLKFKDEIAELEEEFRQKRESHNTAPDEPKKDAATNEDEEDAAQAQKIPLEPSFFFENEDQLISPRIAYLITNILRAAVTEAGGTGGRARAVGKTVVGKTGTTNGYFDAWFLGYSPQISTGVWVGYDQEKTLGRGEAGGKAALPIWVSYMKQAHKEMPDVGFPTPRGIVFANIDSETGKLASSSSSEVVRQAFIEGTQPQLQTEKEQEENIEEQQTDFDRQDF